MELLLVLLFGAAAILVGASGQERTPEAPQVHQPRSIAPFRIRGSTAREITGSMFPQGIAPALVAHDWQDAWSARWLGGLDALAFQSVQLQHDIYSYMAGYFGRLEPVFAYTILTPSRQVVATAVIRWTGTHYILQDAQGLDDNTITADVVQHVEDLVQRINRA